MADRFKIGFFDHPWILLNVALREKHIACLLQGLRGYNIFVISGYGGCARKCEGLYVKIVSRLCRKTSKQSGGMSSCICNLHMSRCVRSLVSHGAD